MVMRFIFKQICCVTKNIIWKFEGNGSFLFPLKSLFFSISFLAPKRKSWKVIVEVLQVFFSGLDECKNESFT